MALEVALGRKGDALDARMLEAARSAGEDDGRDRNGEERQMVDHSGMTEGDDVERGFLFTVNSALCFAMK